MQKKWSPSSWQNKTGKHMPTYKDKAALSSVLNDLSKFPPLVFAGEARKLQKQLAEVAESAHHLQQKILLSGGLHLQFL